MKRTILVILLAAALASMTFLAAAQEPLVPGTVEGSLSSSQATYELTAEEGQVFFLYLNSPDFDAYLEILDTDGEQVDYDDDSGMDSNSALLFVAPEAGTYSVVARAYDGETTGDYALTLVDSIETLTAGSSVELDVDGATPSIFSLESAGSPLNIVADSGGNVDTSLAVYSAEGYLVDSSDDAIGPDPALTPAVLTEGSYYVLLVPYNESAAGTVSLSVEDAELNVLSAEPAIFTFGDTGRENVATFEVEEGTLYRIEVSTSVVSDFNANLSSLDPDVYTYGYFSYTNGLGGSFLYRADISGVIKAEISAGYAVTEDEAVDYSVTVVEVEE